MARTREDVTDTELAVLQVLWDQGPVTIRQITGPEKRTYQFLRPLF